MKLFGLTIERTKALVAPGQFASVGTFGNVLGLFGSLWPVREPFPGAWQRNISGSTPTADIITQSTVWSCITLIMQDIGKIDFDLVKRNAKIWEPVENPAYSPVLRSPNPYQNSIQFIESWVCSRLTRGNTYVLKSRDSRGVVNRLDILDPSRVQVLVAPDSSVYYDLQTDNLAGLASNVTIPDSEIIHDRCNTIFHPLCGLSPLLAALLPAMQSLSIQRSSADFFANSSRPGGVLTAPNRISQEAADRIKAHWEANFGGGDNTGKVAVLGDGLSYAPMAFTAVESDLAKQLGWTDERICGVLHVPPFMVNVGPMPTYDNIEKLNIQYFQQCLQSPIQHIEKSLERGLDLGSDLDIKFNLDDLIRMDSATKIDMAIKGVQGAIFTPDEARQKFNLPPVTGGGNPYLQQQNYSLEALAKRDAQADPFGTAAPAAAPAPSQDTEDPTQKTATLLRFRTRAKALMTRYTKEDADRVERTG